MGGTKIIKTDLAIIELDIDQWIGGTMFIEHGPQSPMKDKRLGIMLTREKMTELRDYLDTVLND